MRPLQLWDHGDQVYLVPSNFCNWLSFFAGQWGKLDLLAEFKRGEGMMGGAITGDEEGMEEKKEEDLHPGLLQLFSRGCPMWWCMLTSNDQLSAVLGNQ